MRTFNSQIQVVQNHLGEEHDLNGWQELLNTRGHKKMHHKKCVIYFFKKLKSTNQFKIRKRIKNDRTLVKVGVKQ